MNNLSNIIIIGDRVLLKPRKHAKTTKSGLYLPPSVKEKEAIQSGYVVKTGPGFPIPLPREPEDDWKPKSKEVDYIPLQCKEGDIAIYLQNNAHELEYDGEKYFIVPQNAILMLIRNDND